MIIVVATLPFGFEGKRRLAQAEASLAALRQTADVLICYDNDRMGEAVGPNAPIQEAFAIADRTISESVRAVAAFAGRKGLVHTSFDELITAFRGEHIRCFFGCGAATGESRAMEALEQAFANPLLNRTRLKEETDCVVISICGGQDLTLNEVQVLMEEFQRHVSDHSRVFFGVTIDPELAGKFTVSILASVAVAAPAEPSTHLFPSNSPTRSLISAPEPEPAVTEAAEEVYYEESAVEEEPVAEAAEEPAPEPESEPAPSSYPRPRTVMTTLRSTVSPSRPPVPPVPPARVPRAVRESQADPVNRGRFEKSEPTIVDGQDLDVPSFLRRNLNPR
ncbi:MAG: hypothetical protein EOP84_25420 [Verrucomicrobiaceae bacterium]|nr:MAG: hypothetical protein EOP84_25420 [Verrucomicrobiaceae bacterium]